MNDRRLEICKVRFLRCKACFSGIIQDRIFLFIRFDKASCIQLQNIFVNCRTVFSVFVAGHYRCVRTFDDTLMLVDTVFISLFVKDVEADLAAELIVL